LVRITRCHSLDTCQESDQRNTRKGTMVPLRTLPFGSLTPFALSVGMKHAPSIIIHLHRTSGLVC
jgi:hypothetical protein